MSWVLTFSTESPQTLCCQCQTSILGRSFPWTYSTSLNLRHNFLNFISTHPALLRRSQTSTVDKKPRLQQSKWTTTSTKKPRLRPAKCCLRALLIGTIKYSEETTTSTVKIIFSPSSCVHHINTCFSADSHSKILKPPLGATSNEFLLHWQSFSSGPSSPQPTISSTHHNFSTNEPPNSDHRSSTFIYSNSNEYVFNPLTPDFQPRGPPQGGRVKSLVWIEEYL